MPLKKQYVVVQGVVYVPPDPGDHIPDMGAHPDQGLPGDQPHPEHPIYLPVPLPPDLGIWGPNDPRPTPPIYIPTPPLGTWGGAGEPFPTPPIYFPIQPPGDLGIWGPNDPRPTPPIYIPIPTPPLGTWGGAGEPFPTPPIELPPIITDPPPDSGRPPLSEEDKQKLIDFLFGNLPPYEGPPQVQPV